MLAFLGKIDFEVPNKIKRFFLWGKEATGNRARDIAMMLVQFLAPQRMNNGEPASFLKFLSKARRKRLRI